MALSKTTQKAVESAGRLAVKDAGGLANLTSNVIEGYMTRGMSVMTASEEYAHENILPYTQDRRAWLDRRGIKYKDPNKTFDSIFRHAIYGLVMKYVSTHNLVAQRRGNGYKLVKK
jgi:hypothetical protein